jgi:hypothetical protein
MATHPLSDFEAAVSVFRESSFLMNGAIGQLQLTDHTHRAQAGETARDVYAFSHAFRSAYERAFAELRERLAEAAQDFATRPAEGASPEAWEQYMTEWADRTRPAAIAEMKKRVAGADPTTAFTVAFKALYLFLRAHQDALCALIHTALSPRGTGPGDYNMTAHLGRANGPVRRFVHECVPEYEEWYLRWREARNRVKRGANFSTYGDAVQMGIRFSSFIPEGGGVSIDASQGVGLADVVEALQMSARLHRAIHVQAEASASRNHDLPG